MLFIVCLRHNTPIRMGTDRMSLAIDRVQRKFNQPIELAQHASSPKVSCPFEVASLPQLYSGVA